MPFLVFEGPDGVGTTTQSKALCDRLVERGLKVAWTAEPDKTSFLGQFIREVFEGVHGPLPPWRTMMHLFQADREMHRIKIEEWLGLGYWVICDRYWLSTLVYQSCCAGEEQEIARKLILELNEGLPQPDLTFVLLETEGELQARRAGKDHYEKDPEFQRKVQAAYEAVQGRSIRQIWVRGLSPEVVGDAIDLQLSEAGF